MPWGEHPGWLARSLSSSSSPEHVISSNWPPQPRPSGFGKFQLLDLTADAHGRLVAGEHCRLYAVRMDIGATSFDRLDDNLVLLGECLHLPVSHDLVHRPVVDREI